MNKFLGTWFAALLLAASASAEEIQSSINGAGVEWPGSPLRFFGLTKTVATTTTVVVLNTVYVHPTCTVVAPGTPPCAVAPPTTPAPPTTTSTSTTPAPTSPTPTTPTTTKKPLFQIISGGTSQLFSGSLTVNKLNPPTLQVNLPDGGNAGNGLFGLFGNKPPINMTVAAGINAAINSPGSGAAAAAGGAAAAGRRRRSQSLEEVLQPSVVETVEVTAVPEFRSAPENTLATELETSQFLHDGHEEFEIIGLSPQHMASRAFPPFGSPITIVRVSRVTVTNSQTVTSVYPSSVPADRVTLTIAGCVPTNLPNTWAAC